MFFIQQNCVALQEKRISLPLPNYEAVQLLPFYPAQKSLFLSTPVFNCQSLAAVLWITLGLIVRELTTNLAMRARWRPVSEWDKRRFTYIYMYIFEFRPQHTWAKFARAVDGLQETWPARNRWSCEPRQVLIIFATMSKTFSLFALSVRAACLLNIYEFELSHQWEVGALWLPKFNGLAVDAPQ